MQAPDPLRRTAPSDLAQDHPGPIVSADGPSPEQLAALAQVFRDAVQASGPSTHAVSAPVSSSGNIHQSNTQAGQTETGPIETLGSAVLESLAQQGRPPTAPAADRSASEFPVAAARVEKIEHLLAATVNRVLVSDPLHDGRREVRLTLQPEILPQAEVRLWRDAGRLHVEFVSAQPSAEWSRLNEHLPQLAKAIQQQHGEWPAITARLADTAGHPGDGRSRQHYQPQPSDEASA